MSKNKVYSCKTCKKEFDPEKSASFFMFDFCSSTCEETRYNQTTDQSMYLCIQEFDVQLSETTTSRVKLGAKFKLDNTKNQGLSDFHLENVSWRQNEPIAWLEVTEEKLIECFQKVSE